MASDTLSEQEVQFRKRARRRLVGAVALVLLMVTLLPMVLDDQEPVAPQQEIAISIPSQDGADFSSSVMPAPPPPVAEPAGTAEAVPAVQATPPADPPVEAQIPVTVQESTPQPVSAKPMAQESAPAEGINQVAAAPVPVPAPAPAPAPEPSVQPMLEEPKPQTAAPLKTGFSVQIGVYSDPVKVKQLQSRLKAQGVATYTEKLGSKIRMRSGPYATRAEAEEVQAKLKQMALASIVVLNK